MVEIVPAEWHGSMLAWSRAILSARLGTGAEPVVPPGASFLSEHYGIFVTLRKRDELRGCIGRITSEEPLSATLPKITLEAALNDRRFPPLSAEELAEVTIEHSILSKPSPVATPQEIVLGRHGVILTLDRRRALFLPEVAVEQRWNLAQTLGALSRKAGLDRESWRSPACRFEVFETQHYGESDG